MSDRSLATHDVDKRRGRRLKVAGAAGMFVGMIVFPVPALAGVVFLAGLGLFVAGRFYD